MTRRSLALLVLASCASTPAPPPPPSGPIAADVLFERHSRAVGGGKAFADKTKAKVKFSVSYPDRGVDGTGEVSIAKGRTTVVMNLEGVGRVQAENADAWATDLSFDANLGRHFTEAKTIGKSTLDGIEVFEVSATMDGKSVTLVFDASGGELLQKREEKSTTRFSDYQDFGGFRLARVITQRTGDRIQVIQVQSVELD
jgi:hypothetical protein